jgi:polyisoprenoid-binding protein YceI
MKKLCFMLPFLWLAILSMAQQFVPTDANSSVKFRIKNLGVNVSGSFTGLKGSIKFDPANVAASAFEVSVNATSINTGIDKRDDHLRKEEYFDVKNYPILHFVSVKVTAGKGGTFNMVGKLTIKNVTKKYLPHSRAREWWLFQ